MDSSPPYYLLNFLGYDICLGLLSMAVKLVFKSIKCFFEGLEGKRYHTYLPSYRCMRKMQPSLRLKIFRSRVLTRSQDCTVRNIRDHAGERTRQDDFERDTFLDLY